jgi:hypothetical protein
MYLEARSAHERAGGRLERFSDDIQLSREDAAEAERIRRAAAVARVGFDLAKEEEHRAQKAYNAANVGAHQARQHLLQLRNREESLTHELAQAERREVRVVATAEAAQGWLARVRERVAGAA